MRRLRRLVAGLVALVRRADMDRDLRDEVEHFYAEAEAELIAAGASPEEARRTVRLRFGEATAVREDVRAHGWENIGESLWIDARVALRRLSRAPGFTAVVVLTLAIGIGSATAIFSVVRPVLLDPLGYPDADRLVWITDRSADGSPIQVTFGSFVEIVERTRAFSELAVSRPWGPILTDGNRPERIPGLRVSARHFAVLGVPPALGPGFDATQDRPGGAPSVVLSDGLWRRIFGGDRSVVGGVVRLDGRMYDVVGVMPATFQDATAPTADVWTLLQYDASLPSFDGREWGHHLNMVGRIAAGTTDEGAARALADLAAQPLGAFARPPWSAMDQGFEVRPLREAVVADVRPTMLALVGAVGLLLLIACANVTILLLAWGARREGELAMRMALGAGRGRLVRQLVAESLVLATLGGVLAVAATTLGSSTLASVVPPSLQPPGGVNVDVGAFLFAVFSASLVGILVSVGPALTLSGTGLRRRWGGRGSSKRHRARRTLVVAEVALALVLLVATGLIMRSVGRLFSIPTGLEPDGLVVMQIQTVGLQGPEPTERFFDAALEAVRGVPGVVAASVTTQLPLSGEWDAYGISLEDVGDADDVDGAASRYVVEPGYFDAMGIPLLAGRDLSEGDVDGAPQAVVVSASLAANAFGDGDPIGRRMRIGRTDRPWYTVVGVVGDVKQSSLASTATAAVYVTPEQWYFTDGVRWIVAREEPGAVPAAENLRRAIARVDPDQAIVRMERMEDLVAGSESRRRFVLSVLRIFGALALVLAAVGLYGVLSRTVAERLSELGVRAALGATRPRIVALVVRQGMALTLVGIVAGVVVAAAASRVLTSLLFEVSPLDPITYAATALLLALVAVTACTVPALRASRADPLKTLRAE